MILKAGVTSLASLERDRTAFGHARRYALSLYGEIIRDHPELDAWLPRILERHQTHDGACKRTIDRRFEELDALLAVHCAALRRQGHQPLRVHDLAVSDGRSSVELHDLLCAQGPVEFVASDRDPRVDVVSARSGRWAVAFDEDGHVVQYVGGMFVISPVVPEHPLVYPLNRLALAWLQRRVLARAEAVRRRALERPLADLEQREVEDCVVFRVPLICRACLERIRAGEIRFEKHDVCEPLGARFHVVRAMNVLNHLRSEALRRAVASLFAGLEEGGLLVVGRSAEDEVARATIWRREGDRLRPLERLNGGSELAEVIEAAGCAAPSAAAPARRTG